MANVITIKDSITAGNGPTELLSGGILMGELAINTNDGILFAGADPGAHVGGLTAAGTAAGAAVVGLDNIMASPLWTVHNTDLANGQSSISDQIIKSGVASKPRMTLENNNADGAGAIIKFLKDGANAAADDKMGELQFYGEDDAGNKQEFGNITVTSPAIATTSEQGKIAFGVACTDDGGVDTCMTITGGAAAASSTVAIAGNLTVAGTTTTENTTIIESTVSVLQFEGTTDNLHETVVKVVDPTADTTWSLPAVAAGNYYFAGLADAATATSLAVTAAEFAYLDGVTSAIQTQIDTKGATAGSSSILTVGALDAGSITSNFAGIDNGTSGIRTNTFTAETSVIPSSSGGADLGSTTAEWGDVFIADDKALKFGSGQDSTIEYDENGDDVLQIAGAHVRIGHGTTTQLQFGDAATYIHQKADGHLGLVADTEIDITATTIDMNGALALSGNLTVGGTFSPGALTASGVLKTDDTTAATSITDGSLQTDGGLSVTFDAVIGDDVIMISDGSVMQFGINSEVKLSHVHNEGLKLTHTATGDDTPVRLTLESTETALIANEVIGAIDFKSASSIGTDAILVAASIEAVATGTFATDNNATKLVFKTAPASGGAVAAERMNLSPAGVLTTTGAIVSGGTVTGSTGACYEAGGTDVAVTDGGTGLSTAAKGSILHTTGANVIAALDGGGSTDKLLVYDYASDLWTVTTTLDGGSF